MSNKKRSAEFFMTFLKVYLERVAMMPIIAHLPPVEKALREMYDEGLVEIINEHYILTSRGRKLLDMITSTPLPVQKFVDPRI